MRPPFLKMLRTLSDDERGVALIELAFAVPLTAFLALGAYDLSRAVVLSLQLEQAAQRVAELALVRRPTDGVTTFMSSEITAMGLTGVTPTVHIGRECNNVRQASYAGSCPSGQYTTRVAIVRLQRTYVPQFNYMALGRLVGGSSPDVAGIPISGSATVRFV